MKSAAGNKPAHIVKGNIFDALGFSASEASALKIKAEILSAILEHVRAKGYTQAQIVDMLDEYQPSVSSLLKGRISQVSIEKLLRYADRLHLKRASQYGPSTGEAAAREFGKRQICDAQRESWQRQVSLLRAFQGRVL